MIIHYLKDTSIALTLTTVVVVMSGRLLGIENRRFVLPALGTGALLMLMALGIGMPYTILGWIVGVVWLLIAGLSQGVAFDKLIKRIYRAQSDIQRSDLSGQPADNRLEADLEELRARLGGRSSVPGYSQVTPDWIRESLEKEQRRLAP